MKPVCTLALIFLAFNLLAQNHIPMNQYYYCPDCNQACDQFIFNKPGNCPQCGMTLVQKDQDGKAILPGEISACFYLQEGVEVLDFAGPMEVFSLAGFKVFTVSKTKGPVMAQNILKVVPDYDIATAPAADMVVFFGGNPAAFRDPELTDWIRKYEKNTQFVLSVCSGAFALGYAGLLNGQTATTFHARIEELREAFPKATVLAGVRFVDNGRVITTAGISAGIDGALHLVARIKGEEAAKAVAREMEYDKWIPNEGVVRGER